MSYDPNTGRFEFNVTGDPNQGEFRDNDPTRGLEADVKSSPTYINAYNLFSSDPQYGQEYLDRLESIATSGRYANESWFAQLRAHSKTDTKNDALLREILVQIDALVEQYMQFINSLPTTQAQQRQQAGINDAVDGGQSIGSSELSSTPQPNMASGQMEVDDPFETLTSFIGSVTSLSGGLIDIVNSGVNMFSKLQDLDLRKNQQMFAFASYLNENGFLISSDGSEIDIDSIIDSFNQSPRVEFVRNEQVVNRAKSRYSRDFYGQLDQYVTSEVMQDLSKLSIDIAFAQRESLHRKSIFERDYFSTLNPENMATYDEASSKYQAEMSKLNVERGQKFNKMYWDLVEKWKEKADSGSWIHQQLLSTLLTGYSPFGMVMSDIGSVTQPLANIASGVSSVKNAFNPVSSEKNVFYKLH